MDREDILVFLKEQRMPPCVDTPLEYCIIALGKAICIQCLLHIFPTRYVILPRANYTPDLPCSISSYILSVPPLLVPACSTFFPCMVLSLAYTISPSCLFHHADSLLATSLNFPLCSTVQPYHSRWHSTPTAYFAFHMYNILVSSCSSLLD
jgi:hypothetical protein